MTGCVHNIPPQLPDMKTVTFIEQTVELAAVTFKFGALVEHFAKGILNHLDLFADTNFSTQSLL